MTPRPRKARPREKKHEHLFMCVVCGSQLVLREALREERRATLDKFYDFMHALAEEGKP